MRAFRLLVLCALVAAALHCHRCAAQGTYPAETYSPEALRADIDHLQRLLLRKHPAPFAYATRDRLEDVLDSLRATVIGPMPELRFLSHIAALYPLLGDGHTMFLPSPFTASRGMFARSLPLLTYWTDGHLFVRSNGSPDPRVRPGMEILAIKGVPAAAIMDTLLRRQVRDGVNTTYPHWILNTYFRAFYRFSFGEPDTFAVDLREGDARSQVRIAALPTDSIAANRMRWEPMRIIAQEQEHYTFETDLDTVRSIALLRIPGFDDLGIPGASPRQCKQHLRRVFAMLERHGIRKLIRDLRNNQGGDPALAKELLAHLLKEPFHLVLDGPAAGRCRPVKRPFTGKLVVLMNGGSFSVTGMVLSCLERHQRATFIGEEAGGNRTVLSGSPQHFVLPNTHIACHISTRTWQLADRPDDGHGVMPTIRVVPTVQAIVNGTDPVLEAAYKALD